MIQLSCLSGIGCVLAEPDLRVTPLRRLSCNPKGFWKAWRDEVLQLKADWRVSSKELTVDAHVKTTAGIQKVNILIDTGAKIPLAFRKDFVDQRHVKMAAFPVRFSMADGKAMGVAQRESSWRKDCPLKTVRNPLQ